MPELDKRMKELRKEVLDTQTREQTEDGTLDFLLKVAADHEYRLCLLELGIN